VDPHQLPVGFDQAFRAEDMKEWPVSARVGNVRNNDPTQIDAV
jgi:hypothetical protein